MLKKILISLVVLVVVGAGATYFFANYQAKQVVDERIAALVDSGQYDNLSYETLNVAPDGTITMTNLLLEEQGITAIIANITITDFDYAHQLPWHMDLAMSGLRFPNGFGDILTQENPAAAAYLNQIMRDDSLPVQIRYQYLYTPENDEQISASMELGLEDSFDFSLASVTRKIPLQALTDPELGNPDPAIAMSQLSAIFGAGELPTTTMVLTDKGLLENLLGAAAATNNANPEDFRNLMISQARNFYLFAPQSIQGVAMQTGIELASFLEGGKTLQVSINPEFGGSFQQLQPQIMGAVFSGDFGKVIDLLHLEITTR